MELTYGPLNSKSFVGRGALAFMIFSALMLFPQARASAQGTAGPMSGAPPADQPPQNTAQAPARSTDLIGGKPNLAGTWQLNVDQSDNPMEKMREAREESGEQGGGRRGGFGGGMGGMGGGGGYGGRRGGQNGNQQGRRALAQLVIEQTPNSAKVSDSSGRLIAQYTSAPDQSGSQQPPANSNTNSDTNAAAPAQWQDNKLVSTVQMRNGGTTTRTYEMSPDNKQLVVTTKIETKRLKDPVTIRQVYDPVYANTGRN